VLAHPLSLASCQPKDNKPQTHYVLPAMKEFTKPNLWAMLEYDCSLGLPFPAPFDSHIMIGIGFSASLSSKGIPGLFWVSKPSSQGLRQMDRVKGDVPEKPKLTIDYKALMESAKSLAAAEDIVARA